MKLEQQEDADQPDAYARSPRGLRIKLKRLEDADRYFRAAVGKGMEQAEANNFLAVALYSEGEQLERLGQDPQAKYREALACTDKALGLKPDHVTASQYRGLALNKLGRRHKRSSRCARRFCCARSWSSCTCRSPTALDADGQRSEAIAEYRRGEDVAPGRRAASGGARAP